MPSCKMTPFRALLDSPEDLRDGVEIDLDYNGRRVRARVVRRSKTPLANLARGIVRYLVELL